MVNPENGGSAAEDQEQPYPSETYAWYVIAVLFLAYTFAFIDRIIIALLVEPIRDAFQISDTQISLLQGFSFALFYTTLGIPIAILADRKKRTAIIGAGIATWSVMCALCGLATTYLQLFLARVGVGIGEAALSPPAYSLIADYFKPASLARALGVYSAGVFVGAGLAFMVGGAVVANMPSWTVPALGWELAPWQVSFIVVGLPGVFVALLMFTVREPFRRGIAATGADGVPFSKVIGHLRREIRIFGPHFLGYGLLALLWSGTSQWVPAFLIRSFGMPLQEIGFWYGLVTIVFGSAGIILGGFYADHMRRGGKFDANMRIGLIAALGLLPFGVAAPLMPEAWLALVLFCPVLFFNGLPYGAAAAALQALSPNRMRAQVSAIYLCIVNLLGIGLGPTVVALITDFGFGDDAAVRYSLAIVNLVVAPLAAFILWKGMAPYGAAIRAQAEEAQP